MAWLANVTTRFFFARAMPNATTGFFDCGRHMFFGTFPAKGKHSNQLVFWGILVLDQSGCVTTGFFFRQGRLAHVTTGFFRRNRLGHVTTRFLFALIRMGCVTTRFLFHIPK